MSVKDPAGIPGHQHLWPRRVEHRAPHRGHGATSAAGAESAALAADSTAASANAHARPLMSLARGPWFTRGPL